MSEAKNIVEKTRILVVDDEAVVLDLMKEILSIDKYEAVLERDPRRALHRLGSEEFDIIISDFRMPAMTGKEFYNKAIEINPGFERKFVFTTGEMDPVRKKQFIREIGAPVISKPFRIEEIRTFIKSFLKGGDKTA